MVKVLSTLKRRWLSIRPSTGILFGIMLLVIVAALKAGEVSPNTLMLLCTLILMGMIIVLGIDTLEAIKKIK